MINIIVCMAKNNAIGYKGELLYHIPEDMKRFKKITTNHVVVMGRKTFDSLPNGLLKDRYNIVLTSDVTFDKADLTLHSFEELDRWIDANKYDKDIFIIGGASLYKYYTRKADKLYLTLVDDIPNKSDTYFIDKDPYEDKYEEVYNSGYKYHNGLRYIFIDLLSHKWINNCIL